MRTLALAAIVGAMSIGLGGIANAQPWNDPNGRFSFDKPAGWTVSVERSEGFTYVVAGNANNECQFVANPNPNTANAHPWDVRRTAADDTQFNEASWLILANSASLVFPNRSAQFVSRSAETAAFWPMQRAELRSPEHAVHAGLQLRPGIDIAGYCLTYGGAEPIDVYNRVLASMSTSNDAQLQTAIEAHQSDRASQEAQVAAQQAAAQAAAQQAQQQTQQSSEERHGRGVDNNHGSGATGSRHH